jgi:hypothetical protein
MSSSLPDSTPDILIIVVQPIPSSIVRWRLWPSLCLLPFNFIREDWLIRPWPTSACQRPSASSLQMTFSYCFLV